MEDTTRQDLAVIIGLTDRKIDDTIANKNLTSKLLNICQQVKAHPNYEHNPEAGKLYYTIASSSVFPLIEEFLPMLIDYCVTKRIDSVPQIQAAMEYLKKNRAFDQATFEPYCGVGVVVTEADVEHVCQTVIDENREKILSDGWENKGVTGSIIGKVKAVLKWASPVLVKSTVERVLDTVLGPKPTEEQAGAQKKSRPKRAKQATQETQEKQKQTKQKLSTLIGRELHSTINSEELMKKHLEFTGGKVFTRFPPEPNGYLHLGHAKAIRFSFSMAQETGGNCYLRFDDTNPAKETEEFIENIKANVAWLGYTPYKVTHASDYFQDMYDLGCELIRRGKAYVDEQPNSAIKEQRKQQIPGPYRDTSPEENLRKFENMRKGLYDEGAACMRMKIDMQNPNPCMRDPVAFRIKYLPHPHVGDKWCVYPTYDFEHCIVDSIENITHSLCTLEFEIRRDSYYWLLEALDLYRPFVWEYSRLNLTYTVMSKRKLQQLVEEGYVSGWDDPRMPTLNGLRRRGYTAQAINKFVDKVGVTRRGNENVISIKLLEHVIRKDLDQNAPRTLGVLDPLPVELNGIESVTTHQAPKFPKQPEKGSYTLRLSGLIYIDRTDFREQVAPDYYGLAPGKIVGLKYVPYKIKLDDVVRDDSGNPLKLKCSIVSSDEKTKGNLHWLSDLDAHAAEIRTFESLFKSEFPNTVENFLEDLNPNSLKVLQNSLVHHELAQSAQVEDKFQFERVGYFSVDQDSRPGHIVINRVVSLHGAKF